MTRIALFLIGLFSAFSAQAATGDTTVIRTHNNVLIQTNPAVGNTKYYAWAQFPKLEPGKTYRSVRLELDMRCPSNLSCGEWDYLNHIFIGRRRGDYNDTLNWEIARFITPYGLQFDKKWEHTWNWDLSDLESLFRDSVEIYYMHTGYEAKNDRGWIINMRFILEEGPQERPITQLSYMYRVNAPYGNDSLFAARTPERNWVSAEGTKTTRIKIIQTGHGMDKPSNCAEFCPRQRFLYIDSVCQDTSWVWRENCGSNPVFPQGGTWIYDRAAWCPGQSVEPYHFEFADGEGQNHRFDLGMESYTKSSGSSNYLIAVYRVEYGDYVHERDAQLEDILSPSSDPQYSRFNPICGEPQVRVKNGGSDTIYALDLDYGIDGGSLSKHYWTGIIGPGESATVQLPYTMDWVRSSDEFIARITKINGLSDQDPSNNSRKVTLPAQTPTYTDRVVVLFRTNNAPMENFYEFLDAAGHVIYRRDNFTTTNTIYRDTFQFYNGCFTFKFEDSGTPNPNYPLNEDGLSWWANTTDGSGILQLRDAWSGGVLKIFNGDFGTNLIQNFTVGYTLNSETPKPKQGRLKVIPNPSQDGFGVDLSELNLNAQQPADLQLVNLQGQLVMARRLQGGYSQLQWVSTQSLEPGVYIVNVRQNADLYSQKIVIY